MSTPGTPNSPEPLKFVGKYKIIRVIARSNDTVYEAVDPNLGRHIALKELTLAPNITGAAKRERIERFSREAKAAGALKHPNIVTIFEVGQHMEHRFIAMEYLEGQTLRDTLNVQGPFSIHDGIHVALQLCDALGYAHQQGVVHRDVKPDNIHLVPPGRTLKLTDFGIARMLSEPSITATGQVFGTPSYMSPEQLTSRAVDHRTDIFSAAVVIYEMLIGKKPFRGDSIVSITYQIMSADPPMPATLPPALQTILTKALAKDPDQRYQNMRALTMDLRKEMLASESPTYRGQSPSRPVYPETSSPTAAFSSPHGAPVTTNQPPPQSTNSPGSRTIGSVAGQSSQSVSSLSSPSTHATSVTSQPSLLTTFDNNPQYRHALLVTTFCSLGTICLVGLTIFGLIQLGQRINNSFHHGRALSAYNQAIAAATDNDLPTAISDYQTAASLAPRDDEISDHCKRGISDCYVALAIHSHQLGRLDEAQTTYNQALEADQTNPVAHYDLASLYEAKNDPVDAMKEYVEAHRIEPQSIAGMDARQKAILGYYTLGQQEYAQGDAVQARQDWQQVIDLDPGSSTADLARERMAQITQ